MDHGGLNSWLQELAPECARVVKGGHGNDATELQWMLAVPVICAGMGTNVMFGAVCRLQQEAHQRGEDVQSKMSAAYRQAIGSHFCERSSWSKKTR